MMPERRQHGFSLVELLVVIAIISILAMMQLRVGIKAIRQAKAVAIGEGMRQNRIGQMADNANRGRLSGDPVTTRERCRETFRQMYENDVAQASGTERSPLTKVQAAVTEVHFALHNDQDFDAYYHTLVDPNASGELEFRGNKLVAKTKNGTEVLLEPLSDRIAGVPTMWEFLSTNMAHMTADTNIRVMYNDGHVESVHYPSQFPASRIVAELGQDYMEKTS